jgi:copper chaperone CopZ
MKKNRDRHLAALIALTAAILFIGTGGSAVAHSYGEDYGGVKQKSRTDTITVPQMQCGMCEERITEALEKVAGISAVSADADHNDVVVTYDPRKITRGAIEKRIAAVGYDAGTAHTTVAAQKALPGCCRPEAGH